MPMISTNFGDLLDPRFQEIFDNTMKYEQQDSMIGELYDMVPHNGRDNMTWSEVGALGDWPAFTGTVTYDEMYQGYDTTVTYVEFASGIQVERKLFDDDQFHIMDQRPEELATSLVRTREKHAARGLNNAFGVDNYFSVNSEGVAMCSNSHTTTSGASTAAGFDNLVTDALSATALTSAVTQQIGFRDDRANRINVVPDEIWIPQDLYDVAYEIVASMGKVDTAENNRNVHEGAYTIKRWRYLTDTNNWFLMDSRMRRRFMKWVDRIPSEFAYAEDIDTLVAKWRGYTRYAQGWINWRHALGAQVS